MPRTTIASPIARVIDWFQTADMREVEIAYDLIQITLRRRKAAAGVKPAASKPAAKKPAGVSQTAPTNGARPLAPPAAPVAAAPQPTQPTQPAAAAPAVQAAPRSRPRPVARAGRPPVGAPPAAAAQEAEPTLPGVEPGS